VLSIEVPVKKPAAPVETFTIGFRSTDNGANINFSWDQTMFQVPVALQ
jgi:hypothetical protein